MFDSAISSGIIGKVKELSNILDPQGRLVIPLEISGTPANLQIIPDVRKLTEMGAKNAIKQGAEKLLDRALGGKGKGLGGLLNF